MISKKNLKLISIASSMPMGILLLVGLIAQFRESLPSWAYGGLVAGAIFMWPFLLLKYVYKK